LADPAPRQRTAPVLWALLTGNFMIATGVMVVPGTLNEISASLQVTVAAAGQLITASGVVMAIGAPVFAAVLAGTDRRRLLTLCLVWYALLHAACALAPDFAWLLPLRVLAVFAPAVFTPQAAACVGLLVPLQERGRAIAFIFLGWSAASVLGTPLGAWVGGTFGWRAAFGLVALLSLASAAWVWRAMPGGLKPPALSLLAWRQTFGSPVLMTTVAVTVLSAAGQFVMFAYFAPYFQARLGLGPAGLGLVFMWFGLFGLLGNVLMSRHIDRLGADRAVLIGIGLMALSLLTFPLGTSVLLLALVLAPWALGCFSSNSAQQARLVAVAPPLAAASVALNTSAMYAGQAIGAGTGGWLIASGRMDELHLWGFCGLVAAMATSVLASRLGHSR